MLGPVRHAEQACLRIKFAPLQSSFATWSTRSWSSVRTSIAAARTYASVVTLSIMREFNAAGHILESMTFRLHHYHLKFGVTNRNRPALTVGS